MTLICFLSCDKWANPTLLFRNEDPFVAMDFTIDFLGQLEIATVHEVLSSYIFDTTPRVRLGDNVGNIVGNLVIYYDSLLDYMNVQFGTSKHNIYVVDMFRLDDNVL